MHTKRIHALALFALAAPVSAHATEFYIRADAGVRAFGSISGTVSDDFDLLLVDADIDPGPTVGGASGIAFSNGFRAELEGRFLSGELFDDGVTSLSSDAIGLYGNVYYDFLGGKRAEPFIGAGLGVQRNRFELEDGGFSVSDSITGFSLQAIYGVAFPLTKNFSIDLAYRFVFTPSIRETTLVDDFPIATDLRRTDHAITAGARLRFS
jgi:opacity protein-like surface antigen